MLTEGELTRYHLLLEHTSRHTPRRVNLLPCALTCAHGFAYCVFSKAARECISHAARYPLSPTGNSLKLLTRLLLSVIAVKNYYTILKYVLSSFIFHLNPSRTLYDRFASSSKSRTSASMEQVLTPAALSEAIKSAWLKESFSVGKILFLLSSAAGAGFEV